MATLAGGLGISHSPGMAAAYDKAHAQNNGKGYDATWQRWYDGTRPVKAWIEALRPTQLVIVYNDHLNHFVFDTYPTLAIGVAPGFAQADEGWGPRPLPDLKGDTAFGWAVTERLVHGGFDMTVCQNMALDHGVYSWLPYVMDVPWDVPVLPIAVNMVRMPLPTSHRLHALGQALRTAIEAYAGDERVLVVGTGGMSHQISGGRFGLTNQELDQYFLANLAENPAPLVDLPQEELMRYGGTEAVELSMWFAMRGALKGEVKRVYDFYARLSVVGCGIIAMENV